MLKREQPDSSRFDGYGTCLWFLASCFLENIRRTTGSFLFFTTRGCFDTRPVHYVVLGRESVNHNLSENKPPMERCSEVIRIPFLKRPLQHPGHARPRKKNDAPKAGGHRWMNSHHRKENKTDKWRRRDGERRQKKSGVVDLLLRFKVTFIGYAPAMIARCVAQSSSVSLVDSIEIKKKRAQDFTLRVTGRKKRRWHKLWISMRPILKRSRRCNKVLTWTNPRCKQLGNKWVPPQRMALSYTSRLPKIP